MRATILVGDCRERMRELADCSVDAVVCDPPYELGFMGKAWDASGIAYDVDVWRECLRVLKPGGHLLAFSGTRTYHRMAVAIEDAGFDIRDQIAWHYGSGFPKSLDVSKAIDKAAGAEREVVGSRDRRSAHDGAQRTSDGDTGESQCANRPSLVAITAPATDAAREWQGWGTALKPATEPICVARKPLSEKNVAANVLRWGTGALNIDGCRIEGEVPQTTQGASSRIYGGGKGLAPEGQQASNPSPLGRWPANLVHDGSAEIVAGFPETQSGTKQGGSYARLSGIHEGGQRTDGIACYADSGSAARFFYCAKASRRERGEGNTHPTVKPVELMRWLVRLVTPKGGTVLDPFTGSGSTGLACQLEQCAFIGCEQSPEYAAIAEARLRGAGLLADVTVKEAA